MPVTSNPVFIKKLQICAANTLAAQICNFLMKTGLLVTGINTIHLELYEGTDPVYVI